MRALIRMGIAICLAMVGPFLGMPSSQASIPEVRDLSIRYAGNGTVEIRAMRNGTGEAIEFVASGGQRCRMGNIGCTMGGLVPGETYSFRVEFFKSDYNPYRETLVRTRELDFSLRVPSMAPRGVRVVADQGSVTVSWQPPSNNGDSKVKKYVVTATPGARSCSTSGSSCRVTGLSGGKTYTFSVVARNGAGAGEPATSKPVRVPTAPTGPVAPPPKPKPTFRLIIEGKSDWFLPSQD